MLPYDHRTGRTPVNSINGRNLNYVYGSAARKTTAKPINQKPQRASKNRATQNTEAYYHAQKKVQKQLRMQTIFCVLIMCGVMFPALLTYIQLNSKVNQLTHSITKIEKEYLALKQSNKEFRDRIDSSIDLEEVRRVAIAELGMVYPEEGQVIYYESQIDDYVESMKVIE